MIKLFTHTDLDGIGCAILAKLAFEEVDIEYCNYDDINQKVEYFYNNDSKNECHITDISIGEKLAEKIDTGHKSCHLLDHHPTALGLNKYDWCTVKVEHESNHIKTSGTELYYEWLSNNHHLKRNETLNNFVSVIRDYDTWRWAELGEQGLICKKINDLLYLYGRDKFIDWCLSEIKTNIFPYLHSSDELILNIKQKEIDEYIKEKDEQLIVSPICGKICGFVFAEKYFSELGNRLCQIHPEIDFVAIIDICKGVVSYRATKDNIDLGKDVAKLFGGGGHPKAAGSQFPKEIQSKVIENIFQ